MVRQQPIRLRGKLFVALDSTYVAAEMWRDSAGNYWLESAIDPVASVDVAEIAPQVGQVPNLIGLIDGRRFETTDSLPMGFVSSVWGDWLLWLEQFRLWKSLSLVAVLVVVLIGVRFALPGISDAAVVLIPKSWDRVLGAQVEEVLDGWLFEASGLDAETQAQAQRLFAPLAAQAFQGTPFSGRLLIRNSELLGANAAALPGGGIIVTDDLLIVLKNHEDELSAVLAHELAHVRHRHGMRHVLRYAGLSFWIFLFGFDGSAIEELAMAYGTLVQSGYSRNFEREADRGAAILLQAKGMDPRALARALTRLEEVLCGVEGCREGGWFASHPDFAERRALIEGG